MMKGFATLKYVLLGLCMSLYAMQAADDPNYCKVKIPKSVKVKAGDTVQVPIKFTLSKKWYIYGFTMMINKEGIGPQQTDIFFTDTTGTLKAGDLSYPKPHTKYDESFEMDVHSYKGSFDCKLPIIANAQAQKGILAFPIEVTFQLCDGNMCLPPKTIAMPFSVTIK